MKKAVGVALGILAFVIAGASVYGIFSLNETIQAKPNQIQVSNYSAQIGSLQPQINSISNNVSSLNTLKGDITDIRGKLFDLESKISQAQQTSVSVKPEILTSQSTYFPGEILYIVAIGFDPQEAVQIQLLDNYGFAIMQKDVLTDSSGRVLDYLQLPSNLEPGSFQVKLVSGQLTASQSVTIMQSSPVSVSSSYPSYLFTAQTDKTIYQTGEEIGIFGIGVPNTSVTAILTSPLGTTSEAVTTVQSYGTYNMFFSDSPPFETGTWSIVVKDQGIEKILFVTVQLGNSSPPTFTAQTDKTIYKKGDLIQISGTGPSYASVNTILTSPSGIKYNGAATINFDGSYNIDYSTLPSFETGNWYVTLAEGSQVKVISIFLEP
ncbi:MAG TPA: hypothetical protein VEU72_00820 [Nitrosopumilaceae archaeon]|nr:hypothetical protein [Nitrosopumilaceae archaeon]